MEARSDATLSEVQPDSRFLSAANGDERIIAAEVIENEWTIYGATSQGVTDFLERARVLGIDPGLLETDEVYATTDLHIVATGSVTNIPYAVGSSPIPGETPCLHTLLADSVNDVIFWTSFEALAPR